MGEPFGLSAKDISKKTNPSNDATQSNKIPTKLLDQVRQVVAKYGLDDAEWAQAISSQFFLLSIAKLLHWKKQDYENLLDKCLSSFRVTYTGAYLIDDNRLLITPDETTLIMKCMEEEDQVDPYYTRSAKMRAENIDSKRMYFNYHYGLLVKIVSFEDTELLRTIKHICLDYLLSDVSIDNSDGWYPYRIPWITARILISLKNIDYQSYPKKELLETEIKDAIESMYHRIDEKEPYWRSGAGNWVSKWESTALCLEALYVWDSIKEPEVDKIVEYLCYTETMNEWLTTNLDFSTEESSNSLLASIILASVLNRVTYKKYPSYYFSIKEKVKNQFDRVIKLINKNDVNKVRQYCTLPQILHYILSAYEIE